MRKLGLTLRLISITLITMSMLTNMTACNKNNNYNDNNNSNNSTVVSDINSNVDENSSESNSNDNSQTDEENKRPVKIDYAKIGTKLEDKNGMYILNNDFGNKYYSDILELGDYILLQNIIYSDDARGGVKSIEWAVYDPILDKIICEKVIDTNFEDYCLTNTYEKGIVLFDISSYSVFLYNDKLEMIGNIKIDEDEGGVYADVLQFSEDLKTMCYISCNDVYDGDTSVTVADISDLSKQTYTKTKIETGLINPSILGMINNDILVLTGTDNHSYINVCKFISIKNGKKLDIDVPSSSCLTVSDDYKYFYYDYGYLDQKVYFGDINGKDYETDVDFDSCLWDFKNNNLILHKVDFDNQIYDYEYYSLNSGKKINECTFSNDDLEGYVSYNNIYLPKYNALLILKNNVENQSMEVMLWDLDVNDEFEEKLNISECNDGRDVTVTDWGELEEVHKKAISIGEKYGVEIYIGNECANQDEWSYKGKLMLDKDKIDAALTSMEIAFERYPEGFIQQLKYGSYRKVKIYLTGTLTASGEYDTLSSCAAFVSTTGDYTYAVFDVDENMIDNVYHEFSHIIDGKLDFTSSLINSSYSEEDWQSLNPDNFEYASYYDYENGDLSKYDSYVYGDISNQYFVSYYSLTYPTEDRATLMESAMANYYFWREDDILNSGLYKKLEYYSKCIRESFDTTGWDSVVAWEKPLVQN